MILVIPWVSGAMMPRRARDPARISSAPEDIVRVEVQHVFARHIVRQHALCTCTAPLGIPVVPLVKCNTAMSSGSVGGITNVLEAAASRVGSDQTPASRSVSTSASSTLQRQARRSPATFCLYSRSVVTRTVASPRLKR